MFGGEIQAGRFTFSKFYERRARRILPALFTVIIATIPFAWLWMVPYQFDEFVRSILAALFFVANIFFWKNSDYFAPVADEKPLLHIWSLAIEEQYYFFFPILLLLCFKYFRRYTFPLLVAIVLSSFLLSVVASYVPKFHTASFFLLPTRLWELGAGSICAFVNLKHIRPQLRDFLSASSLALIIILMFVIDDQSVVTPGPTTALLIAAVALFILSAEKTSIAVKVLSLKPVIFIGLISYSLYLWHQPILALLRLRFAEAESPLWISSAIALTFILAVASYYLVEKPFRRRGPNGLSIKAFSYVATACASVIIGFSVYGAWELKNGYYRFTKITESRAIIDPVEANRDRDETFLLNPKLANSMAAFSTDTEQKVLIIGDSHSIDVFNSLYSNHKAFPHTTFMHRPLQNGCMAVSSDAHDIAKSTRKCLETYFDGDWSNLISPATHVVIAMRWAGLKDESTFKVMLDTAITEIKKRGAIPILATGSVEIRPTSTFLIRDLDRKSAITKENVDRTIYDHLLPIVWRADETVKQVAQQNGVALLDRLKATCNRERKTCHGLTDDGYPVFTDGDHQSIEGARFIGKLMLQNNLASVFNPKTNAGTMHQ